MNTLIRNGANINQPRNVVRGLTYGALVLYVHHLFWDGATPLFIIEGVEPSHWDQLKNQDQAGIQTPGHWPGTLTTELLDLCGRGVQELMSYPKD